MKKYIYFLILTISIGYNVYHIFFKPTTFRTITNTIQLPPEVVEMTDAEVDRVNTLIDSKGYEHAITAAIENSVANVSMVRDSARRDMDSVLALRDLDRKQILEWQRYAVSWRDSFMMAKQSSDTSFLHQGNSIKIEFVHPKNNKPYFNYQYDADIDYLNYWEKKNFLSKKRNYTDFWVNDSRATINGVKKIRVESIPDRVSGSIGVTSRYIRSPYVGPSGAIKIGRLQLGGAYLYDLDRKTWVPTLSGTYNLLEF